MKQLTKQELKDLIKKLEKENKELKDMYEWIKNKFIRGI